MVKIGTRKYASLADAGQDALMSSAVWVECTPDTEPLPDGPPRGLWAAEDCTIDMVDQAGNEHEGFPLVKGYNPFMPSIITSASGDVWLLY